MKDQHLSSIFREALRASREAREQLLSGLSADERRIVEELLQADAHATERRLFETLNRNTEPKY